MIVESNIAELQIIFIAISVSKIVDTLTDGICQRRRRRRRRSSSSSSSSLEYSYVIHLILKNDLEVSEYVKLFELLHIKEYLVCYF